MVKKILMSIAIFTTIWSSASSQNNHLVTNKKEIKMETKSNKEKVVELLNSMENGDTKAVSYINPEKYIQHNLAVADGLAGFGAIMQNAPEGGFKVDVVRAFQDGNYVFTHTIYDFFGDKVGFDVFRFENGLIVEHWDNLAGITPANPSGHTQTDGPTESENHNKTEANKVLIKDFITTILMKGEMDKIGNFFEGDKYIQHNSAIADGLSGLGAALEGMATQGITMVYDKVHYVFGEGNFVLAMSEGKFADQATSYYDLFRVEDGKIVEHWDVMETIPEKSDRKNNNGKF